VVASAFCTALFGRWWVVEGIWGTKTLTNNIISGSRRIRSVATPHRCPWITLMQCRLFRNSTHSGLSLDISLRGGNLYWLSMLFFCIFLFSWIKYKWIYILHPFFLHFFLHYSIFSIFADLPNENPEILIL
jgi:hypothetical protein